MNAIPVRKRKYLKNTSFFDYVNVVSAFLEIFIEDCEDEGLFYVRLDVDCLCFFLCFLSASLSDATEEEVLLHYGHEDEPIPVFSVGEMPLDGPSTLNNIIHCPVKYISKVEKNNCFIIILRRHLLLLWTTTVSFAMGMRSVRRIF